MSYEIDPDELFSDHDDDAQNADAVSPMPHASPTKRPRPANNYANRAPSLGNLKLSLPAGVAPPSRPNAHNHARQNQHRHNNHRQHQHQPHYQHQNRRPPQSRNPPVFVPLPHIPPPSSLEPTRQQARPYGYSNSRPHYGRGGPPRHHHHQHQQPHHIPSYSNQHMNPHRSNQHMNSHHSNQHMNPHHSNQHMNPHQPPQHHRHQQRPQHQQHRPPQHHYQHNQHYQPHYQQKQHQQPQPPQPPQPRPSQSSNHSQALSILPQAHRERLERDDTFKATGVTTSIPNTSSASAERKRPGRRRLSSIPSNRSPGTANGTTTTTLMEQRKRKVLLENVRRAQQDSAKKQTFTGLHSLMKSSSDFIGTAGSASALAKTSTKKRKHESDIFDPDVSENIYANAVMTKEMRAREQREKELEEQRKEQRRLDAIKQVEQQRIQERDERKALQAEWKSVETVASTMRHAYRLDQAERWLFPGSTGDAKKKNTLEYLGLTKKSLPDNNHMSHQLLTVEMIEI